MAKVFGRFARFRFDGVILDVAVNEQIDNAPILGSKTNRDIAYSIATSELLKDFENQLLFVGTKVHYGTKIWTGGERKACEFTYTLKLVMKQEAHLCSTESDGILDIATALN